MTAKCCLLWMRTQRKHSVCVCVCVCQQLCGRQENWISFVQHFVSPQKTEEEETKRTSAELNCKRGTGCLEKCERDASKL